MLVTVRLTKPWAGQPAGMILRLREADATRLIERRQAVREMQPEAERAVTGPAETRG